jgi:hypothetical protein
MSEPYPDFVARFYDAVRLRTERRFEYVVVCRREGQVKPASGRG